MTDDEADGVGSGKGPRARVSLLCFVRFPRRIGLWKNFGFVSDGSASTGLDSSPATLMSATTHLKSELETHSRTHIRREH